ncbi:hypothetical protein DFH06DRAFT_1337907 [Mycena polygramma]|nr:hypothetical protein DFH06DRAFT_1337907 [Mycena polygramma]
MSDSSMDWIWSEYTTSPDPASGMQSLYQTCSALTKHVLQPSHIVLSGGGFALRADLAQLLTNIIPAIGHLCSVAAKQHGREIPQFGQAELQTLTCTTGLFVPATQNQIVWSWVTLIDELNFAMASMKSFWIGIPLTNSDRKRLSQIPRILASLPPSLRVKLPKAFLESYGITVLPPAVNASQASRQKENTHQRLGCIISVAGDLDRVHAPCSPSSSRTSVEVTVRKGTHTDPHSTAVLAERASTVHDLVLEYECGSDPGHCLLARTTHIVRKKDLNSSEIEERVHRSGQLFMGTLALETELLLSTDDTVKEMQSLLTRASSFIPGKACFLVDPDGILMRLLRGANTRGELQTAWASLSERMRLAQMRFKEYHQTASCHDSPVSHCSGSKTWTSSCSQAPCVGAVKPRPRQAPLAATTTRSATNSVPPLKKAKTSAEWESVRTPVQAELHAAIAGELVQASSNFPPMCATPPVSRTPSDVPIAGTEIRQPAPNRARQLSDVVKYLEALALEGRNGPSVDQQHETLGSQGVLTIAELQVTAPARTKEPGERAGNSSLSHDIVAPEPFLLWPRFPAPASTIVGAVELWGLREPRMGLRAGDSKTCVHTASPSTPTVLFSSPLKRSTEAWGLEEILSGKDQGLANSEGSRTELTPTARTDTRQLMQQVEALRGGDARKSILGSRPGRLGEDLYLPTESDAWNLANTQRHVQHHVPGIPLPRLAPNALTITHITPSSKSPSPAFANADAVKVKGLHIEMVEPHARVRAVKLGGLSGTLAVTSQESGHFNEVDTYTEALIVHTRCPSPMPVTTDSAAWVFILEPKPFAPGLVDVLVNGATVELGGLQVPFSSKTKHNGELKSRTCDEDGRPPARRGHASLSSFPALPASSLVPLFMASGKTFALISAIARTQKISYLVWTARGGSAPYLAWEREGIGTAPWICFTGAGAREHI